MNALPSSFASSVQGKQPMTGDLAGGQPFLAPLFDRDDYLLVQTGMEEEDEENDSMDERIDPQLMQETSNSEQQRLLMSSSRNSSRSHRPSPHRQHTIRSLYPTHLAGRQSIVNTLRLHPNLNIRNLFGNMPFSSSIRANHYPADIQDTQAGNLSLPTWAMLPINSVPDLGSLRRTVPGVLREAMELTNMGVSTEQIIEMHPNIAALFDEDVFNNSGLLSKWAVGMVHGVFLKGGYLCTGVQQTSTDNLQAARSHALDPCICSGT
jgi:hypothetical protein